MGLISVPLKSCERYKPGKVFSKELPGDGSKSGEGKQWSLMVSSEGQVIGEVPNWTDLGQGLILYGDFDRK